MDGKNRPRYARSNILLIAFLPGFKLHSPYGYQGRFFGYRGRFCSSKWMGRTVPDMHEHLEKKRYAKKFLKVYLPVHSHKIEAVKDVLIRGMNDIVGKPETIPLYLATLGRRAHGEKIDAKYWYHSLREIALFYQTVSLTLIEGFSHFIEISAHSQLVPFIEQAITSNGSDGKAFQSLVRFEPEDRCLEQSLARMEQHGVIQKIV